MRRLSLARQRQICIWGFFILLVGGGLWIWSPGLPVIWGPSARASDIAAGRELFEHEWTPNDPLAHGDGLGPVYNARSCATCHFQGGLGGGGEVAHNATSYEVHSRPGDDEFHTGTLHAFSVTPAHRESMAVLKGVYPTIPGPTIRDPNCPSMTFPDFDPVRTEKVQPTALYGSGWIDLMSDKAIRHNQRSRQLSAVSREMSHDFGTVPVGRVAISADGRVGKFGWKGQFATLSEFVAAACANELGLGTPKMPQATPLSAPNYESPPDLDKKQFRALVAFVKTLPKPVESVPATAAERESAAGGKELFHSVGCATCHVPDLGGVKGVYSDFLLYNLNDPPGPNSASYSPEPPRVLKLPGRPDHLQRPEEWKTPALWGVADSAPYFHDGASPTLDSAITRHRGDAKNVTARYEELGSTGKSALIAFLKTLKAPPDAVPLSNPGVTRVSR
ncbi:MAG TPA: di-heme oxidoredictase family protein [Gemmataceae bacterium]|nr:di-heme oxidoredictase family protein [Gemmataceae bacterium]